jgi:hypothetical protein
MVADGSAGWRSVCAERSGFFDAQYSDRVGMDGGTVCDQYSEGVVDIHIGGDQESGFGEETVRAFVLRGLLSQYTRRVKPVLTRTPKSLVPLFSTTSLSPGNNQIVQRAV